MKKCCVCALLLLLLAGCAGRSEMTFETVSDDYLSAAVAATPRRISVELPQNAAMLTMKTEDAGTQYLCDDYSVCVQTLPSGDLDKTLRQMTGYGADALTLVETDQNGMKRYDFVWTSAGEGGDQPCRGAILDDGDYHYVLTSMANAGKTEQVERAWEKMFHGFWAS